MKFCLIALTIFAFPWLAAETPVPESSTRPIESGEASGFQSRLKSHVAYLADTIGERNLRKHKQLNQAADYIDEKFRSYGYEPKRQTFQVRGLNCHNITAEIKGSGKPKEIVIIGAHYDSAIGTPGANDNGSGMAALLTLAEKMRSIEPERTLRFVAFTNEEPPWFQTADQMGSWVYARQCRRDDENVVAVISLETMGFYTDQPDSQKYPPPLDRLYPSTGNFVGFVGNLPSAMLQRTVLKSFKKSCDVPCEGASLPGAMPGVGWSDHWSFWQEGYPGIMVTDTAPFRYRHYHRPTDTPDKINFPVFAEVVKGLVETIKELTESETLLRSKPSDKRDLPR